MNFLIVSTGRCGSTLLSSILSKAGANFGLENQDDWDRSTGSYEHPRLDTAYKWHRAGEKIHQEIWPLNRISTFCESRRDAILQEVFNEVDYAKTIELVHLVQTIHQLGFDVKIILCYRSFNGFATSQYRRFGWKLDRIVDHYCSVNKTSLLQLQIFGGCAVSFEELMDPNETNWAGALDQITTFDDQSLIDIRDAMLKPRRHNKIDHVLSEPADRLYNQLQQFKGSTIPSAIETR